MAQQVFTQLQPYLEAVAEACKEEDGVELTRLVSYSCISHKLAYMFARVGVYVWVCTCTHTHPRF